MIACRQIYYDKALHPSSISTFNCCSIFQHFLIDKIKIRFFANLQFFRGFSNFLRISQILSIHKPSLRSCEVPYTINGLNQFSRFDVYRLQTNRKAKNKCTWFLRAHIFYFYNEHFLFVNIKTKTKIFFLCFFFSISILSIGSIS